MLEILRTSEADRDTLVALYRAAFADEDLVPLLHRLLDAGDSVVSLTAEIGSAPVGHIAFTQCSVGGVAAWLLAPLAVAPSHQRKGLGTSLMREGFERAREAGVARVLVLGDPGYYRRAGFSREDGITPPYELPAEWDGAWQSMAINGKAIELAGPLVVPKLWQDKKLWLP
ncbi:MAG: N-acetyltransferase [Planctomycetota bacterium]